MPPKSERDATFSIAYGNQSHTSGNYSRVVGYKNTFFDNKKSLTAQEYIEQNIEYLDKNNYETFIDNCPARIVYEVYQILSDADIDILTNLPKKKRERLEKALNFPF